MPKNTFTIPYKEGKTDFFREKFDEIEKNVRNQWQGLKDEYDKVVINDTNLKVF